MAKKIIEHINHANSINDYWKKVEYLKNFKKGEKSYSNLFLYWKVGIVLSAFYTHTSFFLTHCFFIILLYVYKKKRQNLYNLLL